VRYSSIYFGVLYVLIDDRSRLAVGFHCDVINCELSRRGVRHGMAEASARERCSAIGLTSIHDRGQYLPARRAVLAMVLCVSVCLSVTSRCCTEASGRIELAFGTLPPILGTRVMGKFKFVQNNVRALLSGTFVLNPGLRKMSPRHVDRRNVLSTQLDKGGRLKRDKLDRCRPAKLTIHATVDG